MTTKSPVFGKPWTNESRHDTFVSADERRHELLKEENKNLQVKVKRAAATSVGSDFFVVKTRSLQIKKKSKTAEKSSKKKVEKPKTRAGRRAEKTKRKRQQSA